MTVAELIAALKALPQDLPVVLMEAEGDDYHDLDAIEQGTVIVEGQGGGDEERAAVQLFP
jgi:hypothetical protein